MVGARAGHLALAVFHAAPEVAAADDDAYLHAQFGAGLDDIAHLPDDAEIQPCLLLTGQRFAADLEQDAFIFGFCFHKTTPHFFIFVVLL